MGLGGFEVGTADEGKAALPTPGGASRTITLENRLEFVAMAEAFKMREFWVPVRWANLFCRERISDVLSVVHGSLFLFKLVKKGVVFSFAGCVWPVVVAKKETEK